MAQDQYGNFVGESEPAPAPNPRSMRCCGSGVGAPDDADGNNGQTYVNLSNGDLYAKSNDAWQLVTGSGGSSLVTLGVIEPEGAVTAVSGTAYLNTDLNTFWVKRSGSGNTGWEPNLI